jgi:hypothetical protein
MAHIQTQFGTTAPVMNDDFCGFLQALQAKAQTAIDHILNQNEIDFFQTLTYSLTDIILLPHSTT